MKKAIPVVVVIALGIVAYLLGFGGGPAAPSQEEVVSLWIDLPYAWIGEGILRFNMRNDGTVTLKINKITVKGENIEHPVIEGAQVQARVLRPGQTVELDVSVTKGGPAEYWPEGMYGEIETLTFTIETDKGELRLRCCFAGFGEYTEWWVERID